MGRKPIFRYISLGVSMASAWRYNLSPKVSAMCARSVVATYCFRKASFTASPSMHT